MKLKASTIVAYLSLLHESQHQQHQATAADSSISSSSNFPNLRRSSSSSSSSKSRVLASSNDDIETITFTTETGECNFDILQDALTQQCGDNCDLMSLLGRRLTEQAARAAVATLCHEALQESITPINRNNPRRGGTAFPFYGLTQQGFQFDNNFFDGGTPLNAEYEPVEIIDSQGGARIQQLYDDVAQQQLISSPDYLRDNFADGCEAQAIMCCWVQDRQANDNNGNCNENDCYDKDPADNTDVCYVDLELSQKSNHVEGGFALFPGDSATTGEGDAHCHGFTWSNDVNAPDYRYRGNALFYVSMYDHLETRGYVRNVPGAPMCSCIDKSPTVSRSDCTNVEVEETFVFSRVFRNENNNFIRKATIESTNINFNNCPTEDGQNNDLGRWYDQEVRGQSATSDKIFDRHIVDDCLGGKLCSTCSPSFVLAKNVYCNSYYENKDFDNCSETGDSFEDVWARCESDGDKCMGVQWNACDSDSYDISVKAAGWKLLESGQVVGEDDFGTEDCGGKEQALGHWSVFLKKENPSFIHKPNVYCNDYYEHMDDESCEGGDPFAKVWSKCIADGEKCMGVQWNSCQGDQSDITVNGSWKLLSQGQEVGDADHPTADCGGREQALGHWSVFLKKEGTSELTHYEGFLERKGYALSG